MSSFFTVDTCCTFVGWQAQTYHNNNTNYYEAHLLQTHFVKRIRNCPFERLQRRPRTTFGGPSIGITPVSIEECFFILNFVGVFFLKEEC